jgi:uncharacterized membrane protein
MMMNGSMDSMMGWMMGIGLLGWVLVIALLVTIIFFLVRLLAGGERRDQSRSSLPGKGERSEAP